MQPVAPTAHPIARPDADEHAPYFSKYVARVPGDDAGTALATQLEATLALLAPLDDARARFRYAPGKWSVTEVVGHLRDAEFVFSYRALRFARGDATPLPGFDENAWVPEGRFDGRPLADLIEDWRAVRGATVRLFRSFEPEVLLRRGVANGSPMSVRAAAWNIAGHELHHRALLRERYGLG